MDYLAEYLNENGIEYNYSNSRKYICINKFKYFVKPYINACQSINNILNGNSEMANKLIKNLENIDYTMCIHLGGKDKIYGCCIYIITQFTNFYLYDEGELTDNINFELYDKSTKYIQNNLLHTIDNKLRISVDAYIIKVYPDEIFVFGRGGKISVDNYEDFIKFIQENMAEYIINHDIKIALKD